MLAAVGGGGLVQLAFIVGGGLLRRLGLGAVLFIFFIVFIFVVFAGSGITKLLTECTS